MVFDTHHFVKRLTAAGMPLGQAEVLAEEQARLIDTRLATKDDLTRAVAPLATKEALTDGLAALKTDIVLLKWMAGIGLAGVLSLILKTFF